MISRVQVWPFMNKEKLQQLRVEGFFFFCNTFLFSFFVIGHFCVFALLSCYLLLFFTLLLFRG